LHISGGTLLLRYRLECGGTVLDSSSGALLFTLGNIVSGGLSGADSLIHSGANISGHSVVHCCTLGGNMNSCCLVIAMMVTIPIVSAIPEFSVPSGLSISLGFRVHRGSQQQHCQKLIHYGKI
jgi:hypothetical protein